MRVLRRFSRARVNGGLQYHDGDSLRLHFLVVAVVVIAITITMAIAIATDMDTDMGKKVINANTTRICPRVVAAGSPTQTNGRWCSRALVSGIDGCDTNALERTRVPLTMCTC